MRVSTAFLLAGFILLITGGGQALSRLTGLRRGTLAALCLLIAAGSAFTLPLGPCSVNIGALIVYAAGLRGCVRMRDKLLLFVAAALIGLIGFLILQRVYRAAEPGLLLSIPAMALLPLCIRFPRQSTAAALTAPLFYALWLAVEEASLFECFALELGSADQLDAALFSIAAMSCIQAVYRPIEYVFRRFRRERTTN